jgi:hypothetical protein
MNIYVILIIYIGECCGMKKIVIILFALFISGLIIFNYTHHFDLKKNVPPDQIDYINIVGGNNRINLSIKDDEKVKAIYEYLLDRKCKKVNKLFNGEYLRSDGKHMPYIIDFISPTKVYTIKLYGDDYIAISGKNYFLEDGEFDYNYFVSLHK